MERHFPPGFSQSLSVSVPWTKRRSYIENGRRAQRAVIIGAFTLGYLLEIVKVDHRDGAATRDAISR